MVKIDKADKAHPLLVSQGNKPRRGKVITCICGVEFYLSPYKVRAKNYCSIGCSNKGQLKNTPKICTVCGIGYYTPKSQELHRGISKFCSKKCKGVSMSERQKAENNPSWRGGVSTENHRIRQSKAFKDWRHAVFERDDYTCQFCGIKGGYLEPDHIKPFAYFHDLRFELSNGRTLCKPCHKTTDTYGEGAKKLYALQNQTG